MTRQGASPAGSRALRVLTFTSLFPNRAQPGLGGFVAQRMERWAERYARRWAVVAPVPYFPSLPVDTSWSVYARVPNQEQRGGWPIVHPRYAMVPRVGMYFQGASMAWCARRSVRVLWRTEGPFDLIDAHYVYPDGYAAIKLGRLFGVPVVVSARGTDINLYPELRGVGTRVRTVLQDADALIAVSNALKERMIAFGARPERCHVVRNGVDFERFRVWRGQKFGEPPRLLSVGNLVSGKQVDVLIRSVACLTKNGRNLKLTVAGDGPEKVRLQMLSEELGVAGKVRFLGRIPHENMAEVYADADVFCLASRSEGCPNVVLEALASGMPVVATPVGGIPELVRDGVNGILAEDLGVDPYVVALNRALDGRWDPGVIRRTVSRFSWSDTIDAVHRVFCGVLV